MSKQNKEIENSEPRLVKSHDVKLDVEYAEWIAEVKHRYRSAQVKAAVKVNGEKLWFNWQMGRDLVQKKAEERWGAGVVEQVSLDLRREFPQEDGFSARNLHYMKQWYLYYTTEASKLQRPIAEIVLMTGIVHVTGTEVSDILMIGVARWQKSIILLTLRLSLILSSITSVIMKQLSPSALNVVTGMSMISIPQMMVRMTRLISAVSYRNMTPKTVDIKKNRNY